MKTFPYNKESDEGRRLFRLLDLQYNPGVLDVAKQGQAFQTYDVPSVAQCRANKVSLLFPSNLSGIKRPQVRVESDVELAWGDFSEGITTLDFRHGEELPLTYTQPIEDDSMKMLIDAGLYRDEKFEELMSKLMSDELFDVEADMRVAHLDVVQDGKQVPVLVVEPVDVVHNDHDPSERTNLADLVKRSALLAIELRKDGVSTDDLVTTRPMELDREVYIQDNFRDVIAEREEAAMERAADEESGFVESSELLDQDIDVTDKLKGSLGFDRTTEDDKIRELKDREWEDVRDEPESLDDAPHQPEPSDDSDEFSQEFKDISEMDIEDIEDVDAKRNLPEPEEEEDELDR